MKGPALLRAPFCVRIRTSRRAWHRMTYNFCFFNVNTFFVLKFLMQSYGVIEQETTKSPFFVSVICGGDTISATDSEHLDITVAKKRKPR